LTSLVKAELMKEFLGKMVGDATPDDLESL